MFSFLVKKIRREKNPPEDIYLAEDALETDLAKSNIASIICVTPEPFFLDYKKELINTTLVQGSSDSKPKNEIPSENQKIKRISSSKKESHVNLTPERRIPSVQVRQKSLHTLAASSLYPSLDRIDTPGCSSSSTKPKFTKVKESKSIHDIAKEICLVIEPRILYVATIEKELNRLKGDAQKYVLNIYDMIKKSSKFEYNFTTELDFRNNYSHLNVYKKLYSFDDVKKCHKRANEPIERKMSRIGNSVLVFQSYRKSLRCYNGQKLDIIDCD